MGLVTARVKLKGKNFEVRVDLDEALKIQKGNGDITSALDSPGIYHDLDKGTVVSQKDLEEAFGTSDIYKVSEKIVTKGEVQKTQEFRNQEQETKIKQIVSLIIQNASDQNGNPYTEERIRRAIDEIHYNFTNQSAQQQMPVLVSKLKEIIPIKIETKKVKMIIPAQHTGQAYGILQEYKESEEWLANGSLEVILNIPSGMQLDFYDKINSITHGSVQSEEIKQE
jgi:ribosome maturation protein SDO1